MKFVRLTRLDNSPIWINASLVVTVEPRKGGGAIVVPMGDGLDYDVRETPEAVLNMLLDVADPVVVPVPAPREFAAAVEKEMDAAPSVPESADEQVPAKTAVKAKPARKARTKNAEKVSADRKKSDSPDAAAEQVASDELLDKVRRMAPSTLKKLINTLKVHFKVQDAESVVQELQDRGFVSVDNGRLAWVQAVS